MNLKRERPSAIPAAEGFQKLTENFQAQGSTPVITEAIEFSTAAPVCAVCSDPLSDSFAPSPDGHCETCSTYRPAPPKPPCYPPAAHFTAGGVARLPRIRRFIRRVYAAA